MKILDIPCDSKLWKLKTNDVHLIKESCSWIWSVLVPQGKTGENKVNLDYDILLDLQFSF